jgi:tripartite-type tricarboxylate transporter receptor subunit TctC
VPYPGSAPAVNALLGSHVTAVFADYPTLVSHLKSGALRGLVTTSDARVELLPNVPTLAETGISPYAAEIFYGIVAPAKTPASTVAQLSGWFSTAMQAPEVKPRLAQQGLLPVNKCGDEFGVYLRRQVEEYSRVIRESNIKAE